MANSRSLFRTRSGDRDQLSDKRRRIEVTSAIEAALADARREMSGLERRVADAYQGAVAVLDGSEEYESRSPREEKMITDFEREAEAGRRRVATLKTEVALFSELLSRLTDA